MNIGFYIKWNKFSINNPNKNVIGDELWGEALCKSINKQFKDIQAELYAPNYLPKSKLDVMIYLNDSKPNKMFSDIHILYLQNGYGKNADKLLSSLIKNSYNGFVFFSNKLKNIYDENYKSTNSLYLPFGVDVDLFYPREKQEKYMFECSYVGNDIKGNEATMKYLYPAKDFNFGLFGNWEIPIYKRYFWKNFQTKAPYKKLFEQISKGKIPQSDVPVLYSSTKINLNFTIKSCIDWDVITLRTYEVLACNGFLITDIVPSALKNMKNHMVFTTGNLDLRDKIKYFLKNEKERDDISKYGHEYVIKNASIDIRSRELIEYIKGI